MAVLAIDAGGTRIKLGVVEGGKVTARAVLDANSDAGLAPQLPRIAEALRQISPPDPTGVGMAFPSLVDNATGRVTRDSGKYRDAMSVDLNGWAKAEFGLPFAIENDARMATIGEWRFGAAKGYDDVLMLTLGTGIGTGVVTGGKVLRGKHGQAGCLGGHTIVEINGHRCPCGAIGCAEAESATQVLPGLIREDPRFRRSSLRDAAILDYAAVFVAAQEGDPLATSVKTRSLDVWAALTVSLIHAFDPEIVVFGGGIMAAGEMVLEPIRRRVERDAWMPWGKLKIVRGELGDDAALLACEWLVGSRTESPYEIAIA